MTLVDDSDYEYLNQWKWHIHKNSEGVGVYAKTKMILDNKKVSIYMHRWILNLENLELEVDHKDWNGLNNQRDNLRICNKSQNNINRKPYEKPDCKYKGVSYDKNYKKKPWRARLSSHTLGHFHTPEGAALAYNKKALELYGEFAYLNIIKDEQN